MQDRGKTEFWRREREQKEEEGGMWKRDSVCRNSQNEGSRIEGV